MAGPPLPLFLGVAFYSTQKTRGQSSCSNSNRAVNTPGTPEVPPSQLGLVAFGSVP